MKFSDFAGMDFDSVDAALESFAPDVVSVAIFDSVEELLRNARVEFPVRLQLIHASGFEERSVFTGTGETVTLRFQRPAAAVALVNDDILLESGWWAGLIDVEPGTRAGVYALTVPLARELARSRPSRRVFSMRESGDADIEATARSIDPQVFLEDALRMTMEVYRLNRARSLTGSDTTFGVEVHDSGELRASSCIEIAEDDVRLRTVPSGEPSFSVIFSSLLAFARSTFVTALDPLETQMMSGQVDPRGDLGAFVPLANAWFAAGRSIAEL